MKLLWAGLMISLSGLAISTKAAEDCSLEIVQDLPGSYLIPEGACPIRLSIEVVGTEPITYQWQVRAPGHFEFQDVTGATNSYFYTYGMEPALSGTAYRAQVRNGCDEVHYSRQITTDMCCPPVQPQVVWASAYATNRIFVVFDLPVISEGEPFATLDAGRQIQAIVTNEFDSTMIEIIVDPSTPLETGVDYLLQVGNFVGLPPFLDPLDPNPTSISVRLDPVGDQLLIEGLRVIPPLRRTICPPGGCYDVMVRPRYIIWESNDLLQYATDLEGPWIDLPSARYGHPMVPRRPYFPDYCQPHSAPSQLFFRLVPRVMPANFVE